MELDRVALFDGPASEADAEFVIHDDQDVTASLDEAAALGRRSAAVNGQGLGCAPIIVTVVDWLRSGPSDMRVVLCGRDFRSCILLSTAGRNILTLAHGLGRDSPFMGRLLRHIWALFADATYGPLVLAFGDHEHYDDMKPVRLCAALHYIVLRQLDPQRLPTWPPPSLEPVGPVIRDHYALVSDFCRLVPQTNEVNRSIVLFCGVQHARTTLFPHSATLRFFELGSSAGLNLALDQFAYRCDDPEGRWSYTPAGVANPLVLHVAEWRGPPLVTAPLEVISRRGCDRDPITDLDRLRSFFWPDQADRLARLERALAARPAHLVVEKADAAEWIAERLAAYPTDVADGCISVVFHSIFYQYPPAPVREAIAAAIRGAGARATPQRPLVWVRFENEAVLGAGPSAQRYVLELVWFDGVGPEQRRTLADVHYHGKWVHWRAPP